MDRIHVFLGDLRLGIITKCADNVFRITVNPWTSQGHAVSTTSLCDYTTYKEALQVISNIVPFACRGFITSYKDEIAELRLEMRYCDECGNSFRPEDKYDSFCSHECCITHTGMGEDDDDS